MEMNSTTNHTTSVKVLKDGITIRQSGDAVEGSGIQVLLAYDDIVRTTFNPEIGTAATCTIEMPETSAKTACMLEHSRAPRGWAKSPVKRKGEQLCSHLCTENVGNVFIKFDGRTNLERFIKEVGTKLGGRVQKKAAASSSDGAGAAVGKTSSTGCSDLPIKFDRDGVISNVCSDGDGVAIAESLAAKLANVTLEQHDDIGQALEDVAVLLGGTLETLPGISRLVAGISLLATLKSYSEAHAEVVDKIEEVQEWVLASCKTLGRVATLLSSDRATYHGLLTRVGDKLVELFTFAKEQHPSDKAFFGKVRGFISVQKFNETCETYKSEVNLLMQPAVSMAMLLPQREANCIRGADKP